MNEVHNLPYQEVNQNQLQTKQFVNWSGPDLWMLAVSILSIIAFFVVTHVKHWSYVFPVIWMFFIVPLNARIPKGYGRMYAEIAKQMQSAWLESVLQGVLWRAQDTSTLFKRWLRYRRYRRGRQPIPLRLASVAATIEGEDYRYGILQQTDRPYDHLFITAKGGAFASLDPARQMSAVEELSDVTNLVLAQSELKAGISYVRISGPYDDTKIGTFLGRNANPLILHHEQFDIDADTHSWADWMLQNANQLQMTAHRLGAAEMWPLIVITIRRPRSWKQAVSGKLSSEELDELPIIDLGKEMVQALESASLLELEDVHCLGLAELASVVRCAWDVTDIHEWYRLRANGLIPSTDAQVEAIREQGGDEAVDQALKAWPSEQIVTHRLESAQHGATDVLQMDDNYMAVLRVKQMPERLRSDQVMSLHYRMRQGVWTRMAMVGQAVSGSAETRQLIIGESALVNFESAMFSNRVVRHPKLGRKQRQLHRQAEQISAMTVSQHFNMLLPVVASSTSSLKRSLNHARAMLASQGFESEVVPLSARQMDAFISGALGVNRL